MTAADRADVCTVDRARLERAFTLTAERVPSGLYTVTSGSGAVDGRLVDLDAPARRACPCPDHGHRGVECSHILAAKLAALDPELRAALAQLVREGAEYRRRWESVGTWP